MIAALTALWLVGLPGVRPAAAQERPLDGYAARVNDRIITVGDVMMSIQSAQQRLQYLYENAELAEKLDELFQRGRQQLVEQALILEEFESREDAVIPEHVVDDRVESIIRERFGGARAEFLRALKEQRMSMEDWRSEVRDQIIVQMMRSEEVRRRVDVTPSEVRRYYRENAETYTQPAKVQFRMIVLQKGESEEEAGVKRAEAERLRQQLEDGADFAELAEAVSEGNRAREGGLWDWIEPGSLRSELADAMAGLSAGDISPVIETGDAFYILQLEGRKAASRTPFEEVREEIRERLEESQQEAVYRDWIERLENTHFVKRY